MTLLQKAKKLAVGRTRPKHIVTGELAELVLAFAKAEINLTQFSKVTGRAPDKAFPFAKSLLFSGIRQGVVGQAIFWTGWPGTKGEEQPSRRHGGGE